MLDDERCDHLACARAEQDHDAKYQQHSSKIPPIRKSRMPYNSSQYLSMMLHPEASCSGSRQLLSHGRIELLSCLKRPSRHVVDGSHAERWSIESLCEVRCGSFATEMGYPPDVCFPPDSSGIADIADRQLRANRRHRPVGSASIRFRAERPPRGGRASDDARISGLASRVILVDPRGSEGTGKAQHEKAGSRYGDQVN